LHPYFVLAFFFPIGASSAYDAGAHDV